MFNKSSLCPICDCNQLALLSQSWKQYYNEKSFYLSEKEWFASCMRCGTIFRCPLLSYADYKKYGEDYYNQTNPSQSVEEHAVWHYECFQKPNYDSLRSYLHQNIPPNIAHRWLDVGSIGYATTFNEYNITTIEPDARIVSLGRKLFSNSIINKLLRPKIFCNTIENYEDQHSFDGIIFNNSFYCLPFPMEGLIKAAKLLKPKGHLVITISTIFSGAVPVRTDGMISRVEDVLQGETLWVFHNPKSLEYLCQKAGFELITSQEIPAYGKKTMKAFYFRKSDSIQPHSNLLGESKEIMNEKLADMFSGFSSQTSKTLLQHNNSQTYFFGSMSILNDIATMESLDKIAGYLIFDNNIGDCTINGVKCVSFESFRQSVANTPGKFSVVIASFKYQDEIFSILSTIGDCLVEIFRPNRKSGFESLSFQFAGEKQPCKGFHLQKVSFT